MVLQPPIYSDDFVIEPLQPTASPSGRKTRLLVGVFDGADQFPSRWTVVVLPFAITTGTVTNPQPVDSATML